MTSAIYPVYKGNLLAGSANYNLNVDTTTDGPYCALVTAGYTFSTAHQFFSSVAGNTVGTDQRITAPTITQGVFDGGDLTYVAVTGATCPFFIIYRHTAGANTTWPLVMYYDTPGGGLPIVPNGGNVTIVWNGAGIFAL